VNHYYFYYGLLWRLIIQPIFPRKHSRLGQVRHRGLNYKEESFAIVNAKFLQACHQADSDSDVAHKE